MAVQKRQKAKRPQRETVRSDYGSVAIYTRRHINGCELTDTNDNHCSCPKWLYVKPKEGKAVQKAAETPSFPEACEKARKILDGFHPEIAKARHITEPKLGVTIESALAAYSASLRRRSLSEKYLTNCLLPFTRRKRRQQSGRVINVSLLDYLDRINLAAREPIVRLEHLTSDHLDQWAAEWKINDLSSHSWRGIVRAFFKWARLHDHLVSTPPEFREPQRVKAGNRCGYFTDEQCAKLRAALPFYRMKFSEMPENFAARLGAFMDCARWGGMAIVDIVLFSPRVNLEGDLLVYRRHKSGQIATVLLDQAVAARLRSIPPEEGSDPDRPFRFLRFPDTGEEGNRQLWRARFAGLCEFAGVTHVETETGAKRDPHPHALRDSFAIGAITSGVSLENVARMLGHATTQMTQRSYLFWVKKRVDSCVEDQRAALARRAQPAPAEAEAKPEAPALVN